MRITGGLAGLAWSASRMARKPHSYSPLFFAILSGMKVAEGITRFCPVLYMMGQNTLEKNSNTQGNHSHKDHHQESKHLSSSAGETNEPIINTYR